MDSAGGRSEFALLTAVVARAVAGLPAEAVHAAPTPVEVAWVAPAVWRPGSLASSSSSPRWSPGLHAPGSSALGWPPGLHSSDSLQAAAQVFDWPPGGASIADSSPGPVRPEPSETERAARSRSPLGPLRRGAPGRHARSRGAIPDLSSESARAAALEEFRLSIYADSSRSSLSFKWRTVERMFQAWGWPPFHQHRARWLCWARR